MFFVVWNPLITGKEIIENLAEAIQWQYENLQRQYSGNMKVLVSIWDTLFFLHFVDIPIFFAILNYA